MDVPEVVDSYGRNLGFPEEEALIASMVEERVERLTVPVRSEVLEVHDTGFESTLRVEVVGRARRSEGRRGTEEAVAIMEQIRGDEELARMIQEIEEEELWEVEQDQWHEGYGQWQGLRALDWMGEDEEEVTPAAATRATIMTADGRRVTIPEVSTRRVWMSGHRRPGTEEPVGHPTRPRNVRVGPSSRPSMVHVDYEHGPAQPHEIDSLPTWRINPDHDLIHDTCSICLMSYHARDVIMTLPCLHQFHASCSKQWLKVKRTCPVCKGVAC